TTCLVAVLLVGAAGSVPARAETPTPTLSSIRVTGDARVTAKPDRVQIDVGVTTRATHSQDAAAENARQVEAMLAAVRKAAGPGDAGGVGHARCDRRRRADGGSEPRRTLGSPVSGRRS